jgi:ABC-type transport system substrate-binding protein
VVKVREGVRFQTGTALTAHSVRCAFDQVQKWKVPRPPGTYVTFTGYAATLELAETELTEG